MNAPAAIQGTFADFKIVRGRKVAVLCIEVPLEAADAALAALGGIPNASSENWVAVARLNVGVSSNGKTPDCYSENGGSIPPSPAKPPRRFSELPPAQQAALKCQEPAFQRFVSELTGQPPNESYTTPAMRRLLNVNSRSVLDTDPAATERWLTLLRQFDAWMAHA